LGTDYLLPIEEILNWKISSEQKMIGKYKSQKQKQIMEEETGLLEHTELPFRDGPYIFMVYRLIISSRFK
jgi:hypothetical protein